MFIYGSPCLSLTPHNFVVLPWDNGPSLLCCTFSLSCFYRHNNKGTSLIPDLWITTTDPTSRAKQGGLGGGWQHVRRLFLVHDETYGTQQHIAAPSPLVGRHSLSLQICWELWPSSEPILCVFWLARGVMDRWWWFSEWRNIPMLALDCNALLRKCVYTEGTGSVCSAMHA